MKKILNLIKQHFLCSYIIMNLLFILVGSFLYIERVIIYQYLSLMYIPLLILNTIFIVTYIIKKRLDKESLGFRIFDIFLIIMFIFTLISSILSIDTKAAFFGFINRYEGFFQIIYYFSLFLLSSFLSNKDKKVIAYSIVFIGVIESLFAHLQKYELFNVSTIYFKDKPWATGFASNPNFFASLACLSLTISIGMLFDAISNNEKLINIICIFILTSGLLISDTLSAFIGLIVALIYTAVYAFKKNKKKLLLITILIISFTSLIVSCLGKTETIKDLIKTKDQSLQIVKGNINDDFGTHRMYVWKNAIKVVPNNLTYGVGVDNFYYAFDDKPLIIHYRYVDKAHNEYLQILVCEGIYALISYLLFFGYIVIKRIKYSFKNNELYLIIPVIAYLTQAFFNVSVIEVAPLFYICLGLCSIRNKEIN